MGIGGGVVEHGDALTRAGQSRDDQGLLRVLCHEFRTPVASVQALARALTKPSTALSTEQRVEAARLIADHAEHLSAMLDAVGAVAEHLPKATTDPRRTVIRLVELMSGAAHAAGLPQLDVDVAPLVEAVRIDGPTVRRIVTNLLENARQHGAEPIRLHADQHARALRILVVDSGPGMPSDVAALAFRHDTTAPDGPHGLGLWIVTQLVAMLDGTVRTERNDPTGTRVEVVLPLPR